MIGMIVFFVFLALLALWFAMDALNYEGVEDDGIDREAFLDSYNKKIVIGSPSEQFRQVLREELRRL